MHTCPPSASKPGCHGFQFGHTAQSCQLWKMPICKGEAISDSFWSLEGAILEIMFERFNSNICPKDPKSRIFWGGQRIVCLQ